jgi:hypothetical protein
MLPRLTVPASLAELLAVFRPHLTAPSYRTFGQLTCGLISAGGRRTVTGMLVGAGLGRLWHHGRAHRLFAAARWSPDRLGLALLGLVVARLVPAEAPIVLVIDDTLFRRRGRRVHAAVWTPDGSALRHGVGYGNRWVICAVLVGLPFLGRPVALPVLFRLWQGKGSATPVQLAVQLVQVVAAGFLERRIDVVTDAAYSSAALRTLPAQVSWTLRLRRSACLHGPTPPRTGRRGRPRQRGPRLGTAAELAATAAFAPAQVRGYGTGHRVELAVVACLWWQPLHIRPCRLVLVRGWHPDRRFAARGYDLALLSTDPTSTPEALVARYAARWAIEVAIHDAKQTTGAGQTRVRSRQAVQRTVPFALLAQTLVVLWYADHGDPAGDLAAARIAAPWYATKTEPCYADMHASLRRTLIAARFSPATPQAPTDAEIRAVLTAWSAADPTLAA